MTFDSDQWNSTPLLQDWLGDDQAKRHRREIHFPSGRFGEAIEQAQAVLFLASDESSFVNATDFVVDGGLTKVCAFLASHDSFDFEVVLHRSPLVRTDCSGFRKTPFFYDLPFLDLHQLTFSSSTQNFGKSLTSILGLRDA
jgi:hypothetical protein